ncbi:hypothetical protein T484DRAFT_1932756 [Baffinella frigidus]|nr:hypothetical protein T484DRAFT_1932756 [Cryptophyta sp. CCMP2293]
MFQRHAPTEKIDTVESCVKGMRSADVDEAKQATTNYKTVRSFGLGRVDFADPTKTLPVQHDDDLIACPTCPAPVRPAPRNRKVSDFISKHAASCPTVVRQPTFPFNTLPHLSSMQERQIDELPACAARRGLRAREVRPAAVYEAEQAILVTILTKYKATWAFDSNFTKTLVQQDDDLKPTCIVRCGLHIHQSDFDIRNEETCPTG